ncbi:MAG: hypothetical protein WCC66_09930, partial [Rhizobiaceae bacterium]
MADGLAEAALDASAHAQWPAYCNRRARWHVLPRRGWLTKHNAKIYRVSFQHTVLSNATHSGKDLL